MVNQIDFIASFAEMLGIELGDDQAIDSRSTLDAFLGKSEVGQTLMLEEAGNRALRKGNWKYIAGSKGKKNQKTAELYNLDRDVGEQKNLASERPEIAAEMEQLLQKFVGAKQGIRSFD